MLGPRGFLARCTLCTPPPFTSCFTKIHTDPCTSLPRPGNAGQLVLLSKCSAMLSAQQNPTSMLHLVLSTVSQKHNIYIYTVYRHMYMMIFYITNHDFENCYIRHFRVSYEKKKYYPSSHQRSFGGSRLEANMPGATSFAKALGSSWRPRFHHSLLGGNHFNPQVWV